MNILPKSPRSPCICMSSWNAGSSNNTIAQAEAITYYNIKQKHCQDRKGGQLQKSKNENLKKVQTPFMELWAAAMLGFLPLGSSCVWLSIPSNIIGWMPTEAHCQCKTKWEFMS